MIKFRKAMKGISVLLCLGFFAYSGTAVAKTTPEDIENSLKDTDTYGKCAAAENALTECKNACKYDDLKSQIQNQQALIDSECSQFNSDKSEKKKCTSGQTPNLWQTKLRTGTQAESDFVNDKLKRIKGYLDTKSKLEQQLSTCESKRDSALSKAKSALSTCKSDKKASDKADKKAKEATGKEADAYGKFTDAEKAYKTCVETKGPDSCDKEYKAYLKAAEKYNKKADKANTARDNQAAAKEKSAMNGCNEGQVWDGSQCVKDPEIVAAEKAAAENQQALDDATKAYNACLEKSSKDGEECRDLLKEMNRLSDAQGLNVKSSIPINSKEQCESMGGSWDDATGCGGLAEIEAAKGKTYADCIAKYKEGDLGNIEEGANTYNIFKYIACRITAFVADLRGIVYALAGFGIIFCAYNAIMGKLSFKHLATIATGLFILSMTTKFIEYIVFDGKDKLEFGEYLPNGNHNKYMHEVTAADLNGTANCADDPSLCPSTLLDGMKENSSGWDFWNDIGNTIDSITDGIGAITNAYTTVSNLYDNASNAISNIKDAINGENDQTRAAQEDLNASREGLAQAQENLAAATAALAPVAAAQSMAQSVYNDALDKVNQDKEEINAIQKALNSGDYSQYLSEEARENIANAEKNVEEKQKALDDLKNAYAELQKQTDPEKAKVVEETKALVENDQKELDEIKKALNSGDYSQYMSEESKTAISTAEKTLESANKAVEEQKAKLAANQDKLAELNAALNTSGLEKEKAAAEKNVADLQAQIDALDPSRPAQAAQIEQLKKAQAEAQAKADAAGSKLDDIKAKYGDKSPQEIQAMINSTKADIEDDKYLLNEKQNAAKTAQKDLNDANAAAKKEVQDLASKKQADLNEHKQTLKEAQSDLDNSKSQALKDAQEKIKAAEKDLKEAQTDLKDANSAAKKEVQDILEEKKQELKNDQTLLTDAQKALNEANSELKSAQKEAKNAENAVKAWEGAVEQAQENYDRAKEGAGDFLTNVGKVASNVASLTGNVAYTASSLANAASRVSNDVQNAGRSQSQREYYAKLDATYNNLKRLCKDGNAALAQKCINNPKDSACVSHPEYTKCKDFASIEQEWQESQTGVNNWLNGTGSGIVDGTKNAYDNARSASASVSAVSAAKSSGQTAGNRVNGTLGDILSGVYTAGAAVQQGVNAVNATKKK